MYSLLLALIYIAFISLGLPDSLLGAGWPAMHLDLSAPVQAMGIVTMVISGSTILSSLMSHRLIRKFGTPKVTVVSVFLTAFAMLGFSTATAFWMQPLWGIPYGLGAGAIDAGLNNYVAQHYSSRHMSWLHCFWGVGTIISPYVMGFALKTASWQGGYRLVGALQLGIGALLLVTLPVWRVNRVAEEEKKEKAVGISQALHIPSVPALLLGFFCYCAAESTAMSWASTYFVQAKGQAVEVGARMGSLFFIGMTLSRFLSGFITDKLGDRNMIRLGAAIAVLGTLGLLLPTAGLAVPAACFVIIGFGCGPVYPSIIHATPNNFGADQAGAVIGIQMAAAYLGTTFLPPAFGVLGRAVGFGVMPVFLLVLFGLMIHRVDSVFARKK